MTTQKTDFEKFQKFTWTPKLFRIVASGSIQVCKSWEFCVPQLRCSKHSKQKVVFEYGLSNLTYSTPGWVHVGELQRNTVKWRPDLVTNLGWTHALVLYMLTCDSENGYQRCMCSKEIGLCAQIMMTYLNSIINLIIGVSIWLFNEHKNLHFDGEYDIHISYESYDESRYSLDMDLLTISY